MSRALRVSVVLVAGVLFAGWPACTPSPAYNSTNDQTGASTGSETGEDAAGTGAGTGLDTGTADSTGSDTGAGDQPPASKPSLTVKLKADFAASALSASALVRPELSGEATREAGCPDTMVLQDYPGLPAGVDCDGDGAVVAYITPSSFRIAVKRLALADSDGKVVELVPDVGELARSEVLDLTAEITLPAATLPAGHYVRIEAEMYYYELVMPLNDATATQGIRVYLSDDDFPAEGSLGHHQGDITLVDDASQELGFAPPGGRWTEDTVLPARGETNGGGGTDAETGHLRGLYGDVPSWDQPAFVQGPDQDIFILTQPIELDLTSTNQTMTLVFNVADCWYYEDYDHDGVLTPCGYGEGNPGDACAEGLGWSPILPQPQVRIEAAEAAVSG